MRLGAAGLASVIALPLLSGSPRAELTADLRLEQYAVSIGRAFDASNNYKITGAGIYMGNGKILTASHVVVRTAVEGPVVIAAKRPLAANIARRGAFDKVDVTLLSVDQGMLPKSLRRLAPIRLCDEGPIPGETVTVVAPGNVRNSVIVPSSVLPADLASSLPTLIRDVYSTGNSGAGVFDAELGCLMGIMSRKIERTYWRDVNGVRTEMKEGLAKYFVPAKDIRELLGPLL